MRAHCWLRICKCTAPGAAHLCSARCRSGLASVMLGCCECRGQHGGGSRVRTYDGKWCGRTEPRVANHEAAEAQQRRRAQVQLLLQGREGALLRCVAVSATVAQRRAHYSSVPLRHKALHACKSCEALPDPHSGAGHRRAQELHLRVRQGRQSKRRIERVADAHTDAHTRDSLRRSI